jgi:chromate transport protein ChrA
VARTDFDLRVDWVNPYGKLPAIFYPALVFFSTLSTIYLLFGVGWMYGSYKHWKDLLPIQHYVSAVIAFLLVEMAFNYGFYENYNENGKPSNALLAFVVMLNAARNAISFYMLLVVSLGFVQLI